MTICPICRGRGEVKAGITYGENFNGHGRRHAVVVKINPHAWDAKNKTIWFLDYNEAVPLWSTAICIPCHGTGMEGDHSLINLERKN